METYYLIRPSGARLNFAVCKFRHGVRRGVGHCPHSCMVLSDICNRCEDRYLENVSIIVKLVSGLVLVHIGVKLSAYGHDSVL